MPRVQLLSLLLIALAFIAIGCQKQTQKEGNNAEFNADQPVIEDARNDGSTDTDKTTDGADTLQETGVVQSFNVTAKQWEFEPAIITVTRGDTVKITIQSIDVAHGIAIPDFNVSKRLEPGKTVTIEFVADKTGTFTFFCNVFCGAGHSNMRGTLIVQ